jgi:hypothetical protein
MPQMENSTLCDELEKKVELYLVYLAHVQNSLLMQSGDKASFFRTAEQVGSELSAAIQKIQSFDLNAFNKREAEELSSKAFRHAIASIDSQLKVLERIISIDRKIYFSLKQAIDSLGRSAKANPSLTLDKIERLFSFKQCCREGIGKGLGTTLSADEQLSRLKQQANDAHNKENKELRTIKAATFSSYLRNPDNYNAMDYFKAIDLILRRIGGNTVPYALRGMQPDGVSFIDNTGDEILVAFKSPELDIDISVRNIRLDQSFRLEIQGFIQGGGERSTFSINEHYSDSISETVMNSFQLARLVLKYNESYGNRMGSPAQNNCPGEKARKILDSLFE